MLVATPPAITTFTVKPVPLPPVVVAKLVKVPLVPLPVPLPVGVAVTAGVTNDSSNVDSNFVVVKVPVGDSASKSVFNSVRIFAAVLTSSSPSLSEPSSAIVV